MKDITTYINEVSKGLAQRAYNKATGAQKNRIKKLYKEIYGDDVTKSNISHIKFDYELYSDMSISKNEIENEFKRWNQLSLDGLKKIDIKTSNTGNGVFISIKIDDEVFEVSTEYDEDKVMKIFNYNKDNKIEVDNLKALYKKNRLKFFVLSNPDLVFCPIANCDGYAKRNESSLKNKCNNGHEFCIRCGEVWHKSGNCPEDEVVDKLFKNYCDKLKLKECPSCGIITLKKDGCNHITCSYCRQNWCWLCEEVFQTVEEHYQNPESSCYQRMLEGIIQVDMCQKCDTPSNENNLIIFDRCQHLICKKCLEQYLLGGAEFKIKMNDEVRLKCPIEGCNNNQIFSFQRFLSIIRRIKNKSIADKYRKDVFKHEIKRFNIKNFFSFDNIEDFKKDVNETLKRCNFKNRRNDCYRCLAIANIWLSLFMFIFLIISFLTPMFFQSSLRNYFHNFAIILSKGKGKYLKIPIIISGELLTIIFFIFSFSIYYIYMIVYIARSCCCS